ncbi:hypothetical protein AQJ91_14960 [Streptomyces dysideae]|uniref:Uncharacterized protein n=1 Tax=Streptomyces dysideae TaxID=909626 RepID=A0A101V0N8_9ACTN|nr:hypothetical protein AQJ91_14960 [Streptomyces dysideae]
MRTRVIRRPVYAWFPVAAGAASYVCAVLIIGPLHEEPAAAFLLAGTTIFLSDDLHHGHRPPTSTSTLKPAHTSPLDLQSFAMHTTHCRHLPAAAAGRWLTCV